MKKVPYIDYRFIPKSYAIGEVCHLFEVDKRELRER